MQEFINGMNWFDIAVITTVIMSTLLAFFRGFIKTVLSLVTWLISSASVWAAFPAVSAHFGEASNAKTMIAASLVGVFIVTFIVLAIINHYITKALDNQCQGAMDRTLGFFFGFIRGVMAVCLVFFSVSTTSRMLKVGEEDKYGPSWFANAKTYRVLDLTSTGILGVLPDAVPKEFEKLVADVRDKSMSSLSDGDIKESDIAVKSNTLNEEERAIMRKVTESLPPEDLDRLQRKYDGITSGMTEQERIEVFREMFDVYKQAIKAGKISEDKIIPATDYLKLDKALKPQPAADENGQSQNETGYDKENIKQMDNLVGKF